MNKIFSNDTVKNILKLATGTGFSQVIMFLTIPIITRLYTPEQYALQGIFVSITTIAATIITLNYHQAIPLTLKRFQLKISLKISFYLSILFTSTITLLVFIFSANIAKYFNISEDSSLYLFPIGALLLSFVISLELICFKLKLFGFQAKTQVFYSLVSQTMKIFGVYIYQNGLTLLISIMAAQILKITLMKIKLKESINLKDILFKSNSRKSITAIARKYSSLPLHRMPQTLLSSTTAYLPIFILASNYDLSQSGYYSLAIGVLGVPLTLVGNSLTNVLYPKITELHSLNKDKMHDYVKKSVLITGAIITVPFIIGAFTLENIFSIVFGEIWSHAGIFASILCLQYFFNILIRPIVVAITVVDKNKFYFGFELVSSIFKIITALSCVFLSLTASIFIFYYALVTSLMSLILVIWFFYLHNNNPPNKLRHGHE